MTTSLRLRMKRLAETALPGTFSFYQRLFPTSSILLILPVVFVTITVPQGVKILMRQDIADRIPYGIRIEKPYQIRGEMQMKPYAVGVDVGGTSVKLGLFTAEGEVRKKWEIPTRKEEKGCHILPDIARSIRDTLDEEGIPLASVEGAGLGVPGAVLADGTVNKAVNLGWDVLPAAEELSGMLDGIRVRAANDANAAALGEMWKGGGSGYRNVVLLTLGTGVGGGIILDGRIWAGTNGAGGEVGHIPVNPEETECCGCGNRGCLEQYVSASGIARMARMRLAADETASTLRNSARVTARTVFDAAKAGDALALELVEDFGRILGRACATVAAVVDPEAFVIGGGVSHAGRIVLDVTEKYYRQYAFHASRDAQFRLAELYNDAGIYGAVKLVLQSAADAQE